MEMTREQLIEEVEHLQIERRHAEQSLIRKDKLNRHLVENSLGLMCVHDLKGNLLSINPAATRSLGYEPGDGVGHNLVEYLAPDVRHLFENYLNRIHLNGLDSGVMKLVSRDGHERFWMYRNVLYEEPGSPPRVLGHALDITDRVKTDQALRESEQRFRLMADAAPVMIWLADERGCCTFVNKAWLQFRGQTLDQEIERGWSEGFHPDDRARFLETCFAAFQKRRGFRIELRMLRADGAYRRMVHTGVPRFDPGGSFAGYVGSSVDVTGARISNEPLERLALDLTNIVTVLLGNITQARLEPGLDPMVVDCLTEMERACQRASSLTRELQTLSDGESGRFLDPAMSA